MACMSTSVNGWYCGATLPCRFASTPSSARLNVVTLADSRCGAVRLVSSV
jgi:hypothetical protein